MDKVDFQNPLLFFFKNNRESSLNITLKQAQNGASTLSAFNAGNLGKSDEDVAVILYENLDISMKFMKV